MDEYSLILLCLLCSLLIRFNWLSQCNVVSLTVAAVPLVFVDMFTVCHSFFCLLLSSSSLLLLYE